MMMKDTKQLSLRILMVLALLVIYALVLDDMQLEKIQAQQQNQQKQQQLFTMKSIISGLNTNKSISLNGSMLNHITQIKNKYNLGQTLSRIEVKNKETNITIKLANYQALVRFLTKLAQAEIVVKKINLSHQGEGLVNGRLSLER